MRAAATILLFCGLVPAAWAQPNLLLNPSFESPSIGPASESPVAPTGWLSSGGINYLISNGYSDNWIPGSDGTQLAYLLSSSVPESLSQSGVELAGGQSYQFTLDLSKYVPQPTGTITVTFSDGLSSLSQSFTTVSNDWTSERWQFVAPDSGDYTLTVAATVGTFPVIDNLSLTSYSAVPEPAEAGVFTGLAALLVGLKRARRSRSTSAALRDARGRSP